MPRYLVERTFSSGGRAAAAAEGSATNLCSAVIPANAREGVTWIHSLVTPDRCRSFCIVDSPSPEAIRVAAQATALPVDRVDPRSLMHRLVIVTLAAFTSTRTFALLVLAPMATGGSLS
jgi:hypothetical protein